MTLNEQLVELKDIIENNYDFLKQKYNLIDTIYEAINDLLIFSIEDTIKKSWLESNSSLIDEIKKQCVKIKG